MTVRIMVGHVLDQLALLPDESVHCVVTSPPYFGLRSYGTEPQVWGGDPGCEHDWGAVGKSGQRQRNGAAGGIHEGRQVDKLADNVTLHPATGAFCRQCDAWRSDLGLEPTVELYIEHLVDVFREVRRVLRKDGTLWLNIGDSYANDGKWGGHTGGKHVRALHDSPIGRNKKYTGYKPKDLMMIPAQLALALRADGWVLRSEIIWGKTSPMPESCTDRPTCAHEKIFLFAKSNKSTFWAHRDHEGSRSKPLPDYRWQQTDDHGRVIAEQDFEPPGFRKDWPHWRRINLWDGHDYFYDAEAVKEEAAEATLRWQKYPRYSAAERSGKPDFLRDGRPSSRNMRNWWLLGREPFPEDHFATFPTEIPRRAILAGTSERGVCPQCGAPWVRVVNEGKIAQRRRRDAHDDSAHMAHGEDGRAGGRYISANVTISWRASCGHPAVNPIPPAVLDPFLGAGTTALVADQLGRDCIGIELNPSYAEMAERRIRDDAGMFVEIAAE